MQKSQSKSIWEMCRDVKLAGVAENERFKPHKLSPHRFHSKVHSPAGECKFGFNQFQTRSKRLNRSGVRFRLIEHNAFDSEIETVFPRLVFPARPQKQTK